MGIRFLAGVPLVDCAFLCRSELRKQLIHFDMARIMIHINVGRAQNVILFLYGHTVASFEWTGSFLSSHTKNHSLGIIQVLVGFCRKGPRKRYIARAPFTTRKHQDNDLFYIRNSCPQYKTVKLSHKVIYEPILTFGLLRLPIEQ